ncbi:DUF4374 domain-containing protein [Pedobacter panaciterrae]|jgi:hypothetical protein|uniref:DUF4374 domain-containing protein n=1 Tax=Pedobacter panaciterrae TaxID=363849 RepID=UPI00155DAAB7|nr:DUF4374 domain-containing protein [Pedobacter panaciterrae]NQX56407.1 DUF4374 domain-containing protein [Pedobacter panaciterrae]
MKTTITKTLSALALIAALSSCDKKSDREVIPENPGNYVLAVTPTAIAGVADYLLTASSLDEGSASIIGNGVEQDGTYRYYVTLGNKFFSMLYGQGSPGAVTVYDVKNGKLNKLNDFTAATVQAFAPVNDDILMVKVSRSFAAAGSSTLHTWYIVNSNTNKQTSEGTIDALQPAGNGEIAHFSWIKQVGNKVFAPFFSIKGRTFETDFPDYAGIAVYSYPGMQYEKTIKDTRTSFIGRYFTDGLGQVENGDVYAFSSSVAVNGGVLTSTKPSSITRIKAGTTEFDQSYLMNFETASNGYVITNWLYIGQNKFIANMEPKATKGAYVTGKTLAVVDVVNQTVSAVTGFPEPATIVDVTDNNYSPKDGKTGYIGVNLKDGTTWVYKIDASTSKATRGLKVEGGLITAIQHLQ